MAKFLIFTLFLFSIVSTLTLAFAIQARDNSACAQWYAAHFAHPGKDCTTQAAHGTGPCYVCGPASSNPAEKFCLGACTDTSMDNNNCGTCGNICPGSTVCLSGTCTTVCTSPQVTCGTDFVDLTTDPNNCGACGTVCPAGCTSGVYDQACTPIDANCNPSGHRVA